MRNTAPLQRIDEASDNHISNNEGELSANHLQQLNEPSDDADEDRPDHRQGSPYAEMRVDELSYGEQLDSIIIPE